MKQTGIMGLKCDKQLTSPIMDASAHGCGAVSINLTHHQRERPRSQVTSGPVRSSRAGKKKKEREKRAMIPPHAWP